MKADGAFNCTPSVYKMVFSQFVPGPLIPQCQVILFEGLITIPSSSAINIRMAKFETITF